MRSRDITLRTCTHNSPRHCLRRQAKWRRGGGGACTMSRCDILWMNTSSCWAASPASRTCLLSVHRALQCTGPRHERESPAGTTAGGRCGQHQTRRVGRGLSVWCTSIYTYVSSREAARKDRGRAGRRRGACWRVRADAARVLQARGATLQSPETGGQARRVSSACAAADNMAQDEVAGRGAHGRGGGQRG